MNLNLENKVVVITGGATGIGKACVEKFLEEGCKVAICSTSQNKIDNFLKEFNSKEVIAQRADVSKMEEMEQFAKYVHEKFNSIDIWVNNAGIYPSGDLETMPIDMWQRTFDVNVTGVLFASRAALKYMRKQKSGVIINAESFATLMPTAGRGCYGITKAAVGHITKVLAAEVAADNIRVVSYMPGFVVTELTEDIVDNITEENAKKIKVQLAQNRYGTAEDIAPAIVFMASELASFMTGVGINLDGGKYCVQNPHYAWEKINSNK